MSQLRNTVYQFINKVCDQKLSNVKFPGTLPVSLSRSTLPLLHGLTQSMHSEYIVSYKAEGLRFFLLFLEVDSIAYSVLLNRKMEVTCISTTVYRSALAGTLLDVEKLPLADGSSLLLVFDTLAINGNIVTKYHYLWRLELARLFLHTIAQSEPKLEKTTFSPTHSGMYPSAYADIRLTTGQSHQGPIRMQVKQVYYMQALATLSPATHYPSDGLIWTLGASPYTPFRSGLHNVIKWKPLDRITVDFLIQKTTQKVDWQSLSNIPSTFTSSTGDFGLFSIDSKEDQLVLISLVHLIDIRPGVYECAWTNGQWSIVQHRPDKPTPNHLNTVERTIQNIIEAIPLAEIYEVQKNAL